MIKKSIAVLTMVLLTFAGGNSLASMVSGLEEVRISTLSGFSLAYMMVKKAERKPFARLAAYGGEQEDAASGLLLFIKGPNGDLISNARVTYTLVDAHGAEQRLEAVFTGGGYATDVELTTPGAYLIKAEVDASGKQLVDRFLYVPS